MQDLHEAAVCRRLHPSPDLAGLQGKDQRENEGSLGNTSEAQTVNIAQDPLYAFLKRGGIQHFASAQDAPTRCGRPARAATNYWPAVTCRKCQSLRTKAEGRVIETEAR